MGALPPLCFYLRLPHLIIIIPRCIAWIKTFDPRMTVGIVGRTAAPSAGQRVCVKPEFASRRGRLQPSALLKRLCRPYGRYALLSSRSKARLNGLVPIENKPENNLDKFKLVIYTVVLIAGLD